jgi:hypothetical protein
MGKIILHIDQLHIRLFCKDNYRIKVLYVMFKYSIDMVDLGNFLDRVYELRILYADDNSYLLSIIQ